MRIVLWVTSVLLILVCTHFQSQKIGELILWKKGNNLGQSLEQPCKQVLDYVRDESVRYQNIEIVLYTCFEEIESQLSIEEYSLVLEHMTPKDMRIAVSHEHPEQIAISLFPMVKKSMRRRCASKSFPTTKSLLCNTENHDQINLSIDNYLIERLYTKDVHQSRMLLLSCTSPKRAGRMVRSISENQEQKKNSMLLFLQSCTFESNRERERFLMNQLNQDNENLSVVALEIIRWKIDSALPKLNQISKVLPNGFDKWCVDLARQRILEKR